MSQEIHGLVKPDWFTNHSSLANWFTVGNNAFQLALVQWVSACQSVQEFHASGFTSWTLTHAFLADMGDFSLKVHYLLTHGYIDYSAVNLPEIGLDGKNKGNWVVRNLSDKLVSCRMFRSDDRTFGDYNDGIIWAGVHSMYSRNILLLVRKTHGRR